MARTRGGVRGMKNPRNT